MSIWDGPVPIQGTDVIDIDGIGESGKLVRAMLIKLFQFYKKRGPAKSDMFEIYGSSNSI